MQSRYLTYTTLLFLFIISYSETIVLFGIKLAYPIKAIFWLFSVFLLLFKRYSSTKLEEKSCINIMFLLLILILIDVIRWDLDSALEIMRWITFPATIILFYNNRHKKDSYFLFRFYILLVTFFCFIDSYIWNRELSGFELMSGAELNMHPYYFHTPHQASLSLSFLFFSYVIASNKSDNSNKLIDIPIMLMLIYLIITTGVRLGLVPAFILLVYMSIFKSKKKDVLVNMTVLIGAVASIFLISGISDRLFDKTVTGSFDSRESDQIIASGRPYIWKAYYEMIFHSFDFVSLLFGFGYTKMLNLIESNLNWRVLPHNGVLQIFYTHGLIGIASMFAIHKRMFGIFSKNKILGIGFLIFSGMNILFQLLPYGIDFAVAAILVNEN